MKVQRWRGAVWVSDDGIPWLVAAGQREEGSPDDFYAALAARSHYNAANTPPLTTETHTGDLLPCRARLLDLAWADWEAWFILPSGSWGGWFERFGCRAGGDPSAAFGFVLAGEGDPEPGAGAAAGGEDAFLDPGVDAGRFDPEPGGGFGDGVLAVAAWFPDDVFVLVDGAGSTFPAGGL